MTMRVEPDGKYRGLGMKQKPIFFFVNCGDVGLRSPEVLARCLPKSADPIVAGILHGAWTGVKCVVSPPPSNGAYV